MSSTTTQIPKWNMTADYVETCNCDYGCPCNFNGFPTYGSCQALVLFHIRSGSYGDTRLDDLDFIAAEYWPKAIHEGNGIAQHFITNKANELQRHALVNIVSGQAKGDGPFELFSGTFKYFLEPQFVEIRINLNGKKSSFSVPDVMDVQTESFVNPVTGEEQDTRLQLPNGFIFKLADAIKSKIMRITTPNLNFDHSGRNAFYAVVKYKGP